MSESCSGSCGSCASAGGCNAKLNERIGKIKHFLFVLSGKGGVGKSTVAGALAFTLARAGKKVALLDVDFHGPSQPTLFGQQHVRLQGTEDGLLPLETAGFGLVSVGLLLEEEDQAIVWRGPAKMGVLKQLLEETGWGELDYLILDFPPGTGDEILSACQLLATADRRALIVTTPQEVSLADCRKCLDFCKQLDVPVAGVVENLSGFVCPDCGKRHALFSSGGGEKLAKQYGVPLLAALPLDPAFLQACDAGKLPDGVLKSPAVNAELLKIAAAL